MFKGLIEVETRGQGCYDLTAEVQREVERSGVADGLALLFVRHTTASLLIQENYDPRVQHDLLAFLRRLVPEDATLWTHDDEGPDDMPSHVRTALTHTSELVPIADRQLALGTWQAIYLLEHRHAPHRRQLSLRIWGE